jgi:hypothetical protein
MEMTLETNSAQLRSLQKYLNEKQIHTAVRFAINDSLKTGKVEVRDIVKKKYKGFPNKAIKQAMKTKPANYRVLAGWISITGKRIPMIYFPIDLKKRPIDWTGIANKDRKPKGVSVTLFGKKTLRQGTFVAQLKSGHVGIFHRASKKSLPITEATVKSLPDLISLDDTEKIVMDKMLSVFEDKLLQKTNYILEKAAKK